MRIALPDNDGMNGFSGEKVRLLLNKVASTLEGEDSEYDIIRIKNYLAEMPAERQLSGTMKTQSLTEKI